MKLTVKKSSAKGKKYTATFTKKDGSSKSTHFGATGYSDYTQHHDKDRRKNYHSRHSANKKYDNSPMTAHSLSKHILWGNSTSIQSNISSFKKKFNLN